MDQRISRVGQIKVYTGKCFRLFLGEKQWKNLVSTLIIIVLVSMVTGKEMFQTLSDTRNGSFAIVCACIWIGLFNSIRSVCRERAIVKREHRTGLHISSYILAHVLYEAALCGAEALIVTCGVCVKNASHLPKSGLIFPMGIDMYLTFFLILFSADMLALLISSLVKSESAAMTVMPFVLIVQLIMSGVIFELSGLTEAISYLTIGKWGLNGICAIANTTSKVSLQYTFSGLEGCDATAENLLHIWGILLVFSALYTVLSILFLKQVDRDQR